MSDARRRITYGQLWAEVQRFAEFLRRQGVQRADVVTLQLPNRIEFPVVFFSLELIGVVANKISSDFRAMEVEYVLKFSRSKAYVSASQFKGFDYLAMIRELRPRLPELSLTICVDDVDASDVVSVAKVVHDTPEIDSANCIRMSPLDVMRMCFTSGTTGNPKGVLHCFNTTLCTCETFNRELAVTDKDVMLDYLPVGLNWGYMTLVQAAMAGASARWARSRRSAPRSIWAISTTPRRIATASRRTAGSAPATSGSMRTRKGMCASLDARRRSSTAVARSISPARSRSCSTNTRRSCKRRSSARPIRGSVRRTACAPSSNRVPASR